MKWAYWESSTGLSIVKPRILVNHLMLTSEIYNCKLYKEVESK